MLKCFVALAPLCLFHLTGAEEVLRQDLGAGESLVVTMQEEVPDVLIQRSERTRPYPDNLKAVGLHFSSGDELVVPTDIRMTNLNTSHVIGVHGEGTIVRYGGRWVANGGNSFPHLSLTQGGQFIFTAESSMQLVMRDSFFTRQLWVHGDGSGTLELEEGFVADFTRSEPVADALGTIRLGGATLITHHTRNLPAHTRPDGRGGHYQNGHIVFERIPGNRWVVDSTNQLYGAQLDFNTDATLEIRSSLTHTGHRRLALPVGPGGPFRSSGAFRTTAADVTITKTGPGMLALEGEQSYESGSRLVVESGLLRMATDPGMDRGRDEGSRDQAHLQLEVRNQAHAHFIGERHRLQSIALSNEAKVWIDDDLRIDAIEGIHAGPGTSLTLAGVKVRGKLESSGRIQLSGANEFEVFDHRGELLVVMSRDAGQTAVVSGSEIRLSGQPKIRFGHHRDRLTEDILLAESPDLELGAAFVGEASSLKKRYRFDLVREKDQLWIRNIALIEK
ncbi:MAG: hypothetical protein ACLFS1_04740 [Opitutales bacterium]